MVTIGTGRDDPRAWVQAAYLLLGAMQDGQTGPRGKPPAGSEIAAKLGIHPVTVARAHRELTDMGIIYLVPGYGYFPKVKSLGERRPELGEFLRRQREDRSWASGDGQAAASRPPAMPAT